jgi:hypothetical protein
VACDPAEGKRALAWARARINDPAPLVMEDPNDGAP